jgi:uncharacterized RDD family membrane protein YckC
MTRSGFEPPVPAPVVTRPVVPYAGIATRAVGLAVDAALAQAIVFAGGAVLALVASLVSDARLDTTLGRLLAGAAWLLTVMGYFTLFWSTAGQTPGMRLMGIRVVTAAGVHPGVIRSAWRVVGLGLAIIPLFAGFLPVLIDSRRRALQDFLAATVVVYDGSEVAVAAEAASAAVVADVQPSS